MREHLRRELGCPARQPILAKTGARTQKWRNQTVAHRAAALKGPQMTEVFTPTVLISLAAGASGLGYLIINQMSLRVLMLIGSGFYIAYYATASAAPLYGAIFTSSALMLTNLIGMGALMSRRFKFSLPAKHKDIYDQFDVLNPGDFRMVMKQAERLTLDHDTKVTHEGATVAHLIYVVTGSMSAAKKGAQFAMPAGLFVGEVAYLLDRPSAATITLHAGSEILRWNLTDLRRKARRDPRFKLSIDAMLSHDLAQKVSHAVAAHSMPDAQTP